MANPTISNLIPQASSPDPIESTGHFQNEETQVILFAAGGLLLGGIFREINKKTGIPYTPMLFVLGIVCGFFNEDLGFFGKALDIVSEVDPHGLLLIFLPILIFESGFNADWHIFKKQFFQIITLSVPCVFVSSVFIAVSLKIVLGYGDEYYTWTTAFMFGAILSCTDAVAVLALLKESGASKKFNSLIEGESLINDGTCMVLLTIAGEVVKGGTSMSPVETVGIFLELTVGGTILGILFGFVSAVWIRKIFNDEILVVNITFISCYFVYYIAENVDLGIKISGIIALVSLGLFMAAFGKTKINTESEHAVHTFWKYAVYCAETIIFLVSGIIIGVKMLTGDILPGALPITTIDFVKLLGLYICMTISRFLSIAVFMPILKRHGYGLDWNEVFVLTYGGLRGAIGISFALIVARDEVYSPTLRHFILFDMAGCAFLTLIINAPTTGYLLRKFGLAGSTPLKQRVFLAYLQQFVQEMRDAQEELKVQPYLSAVEWTRVNELVGVMKLESLIDDEMDKLAELDEYYQKPAVYIKNDGKKLIEKDSIVIELLPKNADGEFSESSSEEHFGADQLTSEARNRYLMALKAEYYNLFSQSQCGSNAFLLLKQSADWDLDKESSPMTSWDHVSFYFMNPSYIKMLFFLKELPLVGQFAKNSLFNHLFYVYDVVLNYVNAHESVDALASSFPFTAEVIQKILKESEGNRNLAESYLNNYLNVSFPEVNKSIQIKKASFNVLTRAKAYLEETYHQGQLDEKEFMTLKKIIDRSTYSLGETTDSWDLPPLAEFIKKLHFFSYFSDSEIKEILADAVEKPFGKDEYMIKEEERADHLYVITRGIAKESCRRQGAHYQEKKSVGAIITYHQIVSHVQRYETTVSADSVVYAVRLNLKTIKRLLKKHKEIEEFLWRESFFFLVKTSGYELETFNILDRATLSQVVMMFNYQKYKKNTTIDLTKGGIFLRGQATCMEDKTPGRHEDGQVEKRYNTLAYIPPGAKNILKTEKSCCVFHFTNFERILEAINLGTAFAERKRSMPYTSFRKGSHKAVKAVKDSHSQGKPDIKID